MFERMMFESIWLSDLVNLVKALLYSKFDVWSFVAKGYLSSINHRWTRSGSFDVHKMLFEFVPCWPITQPSPMLYILISGLSICPGPSEVPSCITCISRSEGQIMVGETVDVNLTFSCRKKKWGLRQKVDFRTLQCMASDGGMTTTPRS